MSILRALGNAGGVFPWPLPYTCPLLKLAIRIKKPIKTKFRLPVFNWTALKPNQINGTVFSELDDEKILEVTGFWGPEGWGWGLRTKMPLQPDLLVLEKLLGRAKLILYQL